MREKLDKICSILVHVRYKGRHINGINRLCDALSERNILIDLKDMDKIFSFGTIIIRNEKVKITIIFNGNIESAFVYVKDIDVTYKKGNWYTYINNKLLPEILSIIEPMYNDMLREEEKSKNDMLEECNKIFIEDIDKEDKPTLSFIDKIKIFLRGKKKEKVNGR